MRSSQTGTFRIHNRSLLATVTVTTTGTVYGAGGAAVNISSAGLKTSGLAWLTSAMNLYDLFRFTSLKVTWCPAASIQTTGVIGFYYDPNPGTAAPTSFTALASNAGVVTTQIAVAASLNVHPSRLKRLPWYLTQGTDVPATTQGTLVTAWASGAIPSVNGQVTLGTLWIEYTVELRNPTWIPPAGRGIEAGPGTAQESGCIEQDMLEVLENIQTTQGQQKQLQQQINMNVAALAKNPIPSTTVADISATADGMESVNTALQDYASTVNGISTKISDIEEIVYRILAKIQQQPAQHAEVNPLELLPEDIVDFGMQDAACSPAFGE